MTQKIASPLPTVGASSKMGRNPFAAKTTPRSARHILDELDQITATAKADANIGWLERVVSLPVRSLVFGLKTCCLVSCAIWPHTLESGNFSYISTCFVSILFSKNLIK